MVCVQQSWKNMTSVLCTLGPAYNQQKDSIEIARCTWLLVLTDIVKTTPGVFQFYFIYVRVKVIAKATSLQMGS